MSEERNIARRDGDALPSVTGRDDPAWAAAHTRLMAFLHCRADDGYRVGKITEEDKYGPFPVCAGPGADPAPE